MVDFIVIEKKEEDRWKGHGSRKFKLAPRKGEYIELNDSEGIAQIYEVIAVIHPEDESPTAGDLIVKYINNHIDFRKSL